MSLHYLVSVGVYLGGFGLPDCRLGFKKEFKWSREKFVISDGMKLCRAFQTQPQPRSIRHAFRFGRNIIESDFDRVVMKEKQTCVKKSRKKVTNKFCFTSYQALYSALFGVTLVFTKHTKRNTKPLLMRHQVARWNNWDTKVISLSVTAWNTSAPFP